MLENSLNLLEPSHYFLMTPQGPERWTETEPKQLFHLYCKIKLMQTCLFSIMQSFPSKRCLCCWQALFEELRIWRSLVSHINTVRLYALPEFHQVPYNRHPYWSNLPAVCNPCFWRGTKEIEIGRKRNESKTEEWKSKETWIDRDRQTDRGTWEMTEREAANRNCFSMSGEIMTMMLKRRESSRNTKTDTKEPWNKLQFCFHERRDWQWGEREAMLHT